MPDLRVLEDYRLLGRVRHAYSQGNGEAALHQEDAVFLSPFPTAMVPRLLFGALPDPFLTAPCPAALPATA